MTASASNSELTLTERMAGIQLLALDVDGVLTRGDMIYTASGEDMMVFNAKDGVGISLALRQNVSIALVTARDSVIVTRRAEVLGISHVRQGAKNKLAAMESLAIELGLSLSQIAYMGDDVPDIPALESVGLACCPQDAVEAVKSLCHWVSAKDGGCGAVRELIDAMLLVKNV